MVAVEGCQERCGKLVISSSQHPIQLSQPEVLSQLWRTVFHHIEHHVFVKDVTQSSKEAALSDVHLSSTSNEMNLLT